MRIRPAGDGAVVVELKSEAAVLALWEALSRRPAPGMLEAVPGRRSVLVVWDPDRAGSAEVAHALRVLGESPGRPSQGPAPPARRRSVTVPVVYGGPAGRDLEEVAARLGLEGEAVVRLHAGSTYRVEMLGFMPGFAYLGTLDERLRMPRRATPRLRVPAGSVGIAGKHTGIYPVDSPGGWHLLGRTWLRLWNPGSRRPARLRPGDRVRFRPVALEQAPADWAARLLQEAAAGA